MSFSGPTTTSDTSSGSSHSSHAGPGLDSMADRTAMRDAERIASPQSQRGAGLPPAGAGAGVGTAGQDRSQLIAPRARFSTLSTTSTTTTFSSMTSSNSSAPTSPLSSTYRRATRTRMPYSPMQQFGPPSPTAAAAALPTPIQTETTLPPGAAPPISPSQSGASYATAPASPRAHRRSSQHSPTTRVPISNNTRYPRASVELDTESDREREREFYGVDDGEDRGKEDSPLNPPRPSFFAESRARSSWSSQDSSVDPASSVNGASDSESSKETHGIFYVKVLLTKCTNIA